MWIQAFGGLVVATRLHTPGSLFLGIPFLAGETLAPNASYADALGSYKGGVIYYLAGVLFLK